LPAFAVREEIVKSISDNQVSLVVDSTGCGKKKVKLLVQSSPPGKICCKLPTVLFAGNGQLILLPVAIRMALLLSHVNLIPAI
jgi:hypothetical protein